MNFSELSLTLTNKLTKELNYDAEKKEIIAYAIEAGLLSISGAIMLILFSYALNVLRPTGIAAVFGVLLRRVSGGAHFNTPLKCLVIGAAIYTGLGFLVTKLIQYNLTNQFILLLILLISLLIVFFLAPVDSEAKPIYSSRLRLILKISSLLFVLLSLLMVVFTHYQLVNISAALGILYQSLTLLPIFNKKGGG